MSRHAAPAPRHPWLGPRLLAAALGLAAIACAVATPTATQPRQWWLVGGGVVAGAAAALVAVPAITRGRRWLPARAVGFVLVAAALGSLALTWAGILDLRAGGRQARGFGALPLVALLGVLAGLALAVGGDRVVAAYRIASGLDPADVTSSGRSPRGGGGR